MPGSRLSTRAQEFADRELLRALMIQVLLLTWCSFQAQIAELQSRRAQGAAPPFGRGDRLRIRVLSGRAERPGPSRHSGPASTTGYRMVEAVVSGFTTSR